MKVFLGSSSESLDHLFEIAAWLKEYGLEPMPWNLPTLFLPGENTFLKLIEISQTVGAAVFVFAEDDKVWYRADTVSQPRDNVLLEYGLFVGALGPKRAIICTRGKPKAATDLQGITCVDSSPESIQRAQDQIKAWVEGLKSTPTPVKQLIEPTSVGFKSVFRNTGIFIDFGVLQSMAIDPDNSVVVLPANEFFDARCFEDVKTAAGAFVQQHFPARAGELQQIVLENMPDVRGESVGRPGRPPLQSYGVGTCVYLNKPLGSRFRLIFASVASDRPPDGLRTDLSTVFKVIEEIRRIVAEERIASVYVPLLGSGKGGIAAEIAFHALVGAILATRCKGGGHHLQEVHIVVYAPAGRLPQLTQERAEHHVEQLVRLYQNVSA